MLNIFETMDLKWILELKKPFHIVKNNVSKERIDG